MASESPLVSSTDWPALLDVLDRGLVRVVGDRVAAANAGFARMVGLPAGELAGREVGDLFEAEGAPLRVLVPGDGLALRDLQGRLRPVSLRAVREGLWLVVDRERESRLEREVWRLASEKREIAPPADEPLRGEQIGMIEHEIRTAVTAVRGYLRWLGGERERLLEPEHWSYVREARRATERVAPLLDNLLELAREGDPLPSEKKPLSLHHVVELAGRTARPLLADRGVKLSLELDADPDALLGDPERLEQVFVNLLANAAAHSPQGAHVHVATEVAELASGPVLQIAVVDDGPGVASHDAERIFGAFVQGHRSVGVASGGVGLGLAICRRIVRAHGGEICAVPDVGHGLFRVTLPRPS